MAKHRLNDVNSDRGPVVEVEPFAKRTRQPVRPLYMPPEPSTHVSPTPALLAPSPEIPPYNPGLLALPSLTLGPNDMDYTPAHGYLHELPPVIPSSANAYRPPRHCTEPKTPPSLPSVGPYVPPLPYLSLPLAPAQPMYAPTPWTNSQRQTGSCTLCPVCKTHPLTFSRCTVTCSCGLAVDVGHESDPLGALNRRLESFQEKHMRVCPGEPQVLVAPFGDQGRQSLVMECRICQDYRFVL
ncbi:hypothetical protein IWQ60_001807 [Tieghemiomyces parasiticus]|uniref:RPA-interacting protein C-terminal domain-containing protein n=1 Tax=Tieghemiomyces parasiticus TaxID=78921 RepID=A0A9W8AGB5_9FUNG|nr:hypothetical protein IWQ60_001807 [Tieghemiomyces parasiticus]